MYFTPEELEQHRKQYGVQPPSGSVNQGEDRKARFNRILQDELAQGGELKTAVAEDPVKEESGFLSKAGTVAKDVTTGVGQSILGAGKSLLNAGADYAMTQTGGFVKPDIAKAASQVAKNKYEEILPEEGLAPKNTSQKVGKFIGSAALTALPGALAGKVVKGASALANSPKILKWLAPLAAEGVGSAAATAVDEGTTEDFFKNAMLYGALTGAGAGVSKGTQFLTKKAPSQLVNTALRVPLDETKQAIKFGGKTLGDELLERGIAGSDKELLKKSMTGLEENEDMLQDILSTTNQLAGRKGQITRDELHDFLLPIADKYASTPGMKGSVDAFKNVLNEAPEVFDLADGNFIKRNLYNALQDRAFKLDPSLSTKKEAMKAMAKGIKTLIEKKTEAAGIKGVKELNKELSVYGRLQDRIIDKQARAQKNNLLGLGDVLRIGAGASVGAANGDTNESLMGAAAALLLGKAAGTTVAKTYGAKVLKNVGKALDNLPADSAGKITKASLYEAIRSAIGGQKDQ